MFSTEFPLYMADTGLNWKALSGSNSEQVQRTVEPFMIEPGLISRSLAHEAIISSLQNERNSGVGVIKANNLDIEAATALKTASLEQTTGFVYPARVQSIFGPSGCGVI